MSEEILVNSSKAKQQKINYLLVISISLALLYFASGYCKWLEIVVSIFACIFFVFAPIDKSFCLFLFLHNFIESNINTAYGFRLTFNLFTVILGIKYIIGLIRKKYKFYPRIFTLLAVVFFISVFLSLGKEQYYAAETYLSYIPLTYLIFATRKEFKIDSVMNYFLLGFVISTLFALFSQILPNYQYIISSNRFPAFAENPNYLYMRAILVILFYMHMFLLEKLSIIKLCLIYLYSAFITILTLSKTGIALLALITLLFFIIYLRNDFKKRIKHVAFFLLGILVFAIVLNKYLRMAYNRFSYDNGNFISSLLTDRDKIWIVYVKQWCKSPLTFLFGNGLLTAEPYVESLEMSMASHNLYLFLLYRFGLIGCLILGISVILMVIKSSKNKQLYISGFLPILWIIIQSFCDNTFKVFNFMFLIMPFFILFNQVKLDE